MTLRRRLVVAFAYLLVLTVVALAIPLGISVDRRAKDAFYNRLSTQAQVIASSLGGSAIPAAARPACAAVRRTAARPTHASS